MTHPHRMTAFALSLGLAASAGGVSAADTGSGHFRMADDRVAFRHAIAVRHDAAVDAAASEIYVFLSDRPLDPATVAAAFDPDDGARESYGEHSGGYVRLCITAEGEECGLFYRRFEPSDSFNSSGYGELTLTTRSDGRIAGRWALEEPEDFFDKTYDFDLRFDAKIHVAPGTALPAGGGDAGKAYRAYAAAVARGDIAALRPFLGDGADWRLPDSEPARVRETLKELRDSQPLDPEILRGRRDGDSVVLWIRGVDRDDIAREGRVRMRRHDGAWVIESRDLDSVDR